MPKRFAAYTLHDIMVFSANNSAPPAATDLQDIVPTYEMQKGCGEASGSELRATHHPSLPSSRSTVAVLVASRCQTSWPRYSAVQAGMVQALEAVPFSSA